MPKGLSLKKKAPKSGQSSITAFFKKTAEKKPTSCSSNNGVTSTISAPTSKRKATSPLEHSRSKISSGILIVDKGRIPLIEICDSPSNSPPLELSGHSVVSVTCNNDTTKPPKLTGCVEENVLNAKSDNSPVRRSPRKHEQQITSMVKNPAKCRKKLCLKDQHVIKKDPIQLPKATISSTIKCLEMNEKQNVMGSPAKEITSPKLFNELCVCDDRDAPSDEIKQNRIVTPVKTNKVTYPTNPKASQCYLDSSPIVPRTSPRKLNLTPTKSPVLNDQRTTLENENKVENQENMDSIFDDEWSMKEFEEATDLEELDLSTFQRCDIVSITIISDHCSEVKLKDCNGKRATCLLEGIWNSLPLQTGDTLSVLASREGDCWRVSDRGGLLVYRPDVLLSSTAVVGGVFCRRKAVLQEKFRGLDGANKAMTIGILVHELLQVSLQQRLCTVTEVQRACDHLMSSPSSVRLLYDAQLPLDEARHEMDTFVPQIVRFADEYVMNPRDNSGNKTRKAEEWRGRIERVLDIEENIVTPQLGLKGKIDVTLQVNLHNHKGGGSEMAPLELKTGRATASAEHRGQLILYMMMMSLQSGRKVSQGLLLYLKDIINLKVITSGHPEQRDLLMLRNQLAQYLAPRSKSEPANMDSALSATAESIETNGTAGLANLELPEPINHHACGKCAYLTTCSLYQWHTKSTDLNDNHILTRLREQAVGHLSEAHIRYFLRWTALLLLEDLEKTSQNPLHKIWTTSPQERERQGRCLSELQLADVQPSGDRFLHTFMRPPCGGGSSGSHGEKQRERYALSVGDYAVVSTRSKVWVTAGAITHLDADVVCALLDRDLTERNAKDARYHLDSYETQSQLGFNFTNLGALMDNDEKSERLRRLIIDVSPAQFAAKLPREVGRLGARLLKPLNLLQQRAVLRAVAATHYTLLHGMPGTGKTQTVAVLIQMLVALGQKVLVTAHTHSAVDNVLQRLPEDMRVLRLGSSARVSARLARCSEDELTKHCSTPEELRQVYDSMDVVGVTCLGAGHSMLGKRVFDVCVVDESTQVVQSTTLRALLAATRFVLVGDPHQLPPLVRSNLARKLGMDESIFSRLHGGEATVSLSAQYRMNARVSALANLFTYDGQLTCANASVRDAHIHTNEQKVKEQYSTTLPWLADCLSSHVDKSVLLLNTGCTVQWRGTKEDEGNVISNVAEALVVMALVKALIQAGLTSDDIGVITPYRDQVALLKNCIGNLQSNLPGWRRSPRKCDGERRYGVEVNTVDQYQGRDKSVIVYSCCKTWQPERGEYTVKDSEILEDKRRLTVAITRAKHKLILVADVKTLRHYSTFSHLFHCLRKLDDESNTSSEIDIGQPYQVLQNELGMFL